MKKVTFHPLDIQYKEINDRAVVFLFGRTTEGEQILVQDDSLEPYFYAILKDDSNAKTFMTRINKIKLESKTYIAEVKKSEIVKKNLLGKETIAIKIYCNLPKSVPIIRKEIKDWSIVKDCYEYDIPFVRRYLIDKNIIPLTTCEARGEIITFKARTLTFKAESVKQISSESIENPKFLAFDIETYNPDGRVPQPEKNPILMVSFYGENFKKVITWKRFKTENKYIEFVDGEEELLTRFKEVIEKEKPDFLCGYYSDGFDLPYIRERCSHYKIKLDLGLDYSDLSFKKGANQVSVIKGIVHLDILNFIRRVVSRQLQTYIYTLDAVSEELLGEKKIEVDMDELHKAWDTNPEKLDKFAEYNLHDSRLVFKLCKLLWPNMEELVKIVGVPFFDCIRMGFSQLVEWFILRQTPEFNEIILNNPHHDEVLKRREQSYTGAFVIEPKPGLHKNIVVLDFRSLYPSIIVSHNIGIATANCNCCKDTAKKAPVEEKDYWFCKENKGFLPSLVEDLISRRARIKEMTKKNNNILLKARSEALKVLANSFYGYLAFFGARYYSMESARSVTAYGRYYIHDVAAKAEKKGFEVLYGDTDSIFLGLKDKKQKDADDFLDEINEDLPGVMELENEGYYPAGIFVSAKVGAYGAKKRYALIDENEKIKVVGFETVRRNVSNITKETQQKVLKIILSENNKEKALKVVQKVIKDIKEKKIPNEKMVIHTQLQKDVTEYTAVGPHVAVALRMQKAGMFAGPGTMIDYIIANGTGIIRDRAKFPEEVKEGDYDPEYYINNQILPSLEKIFEVLGYSKEDLESTGQSKLGAFFG